MRVLSPGDDGSLTQTVTVSSSSATQNVSTTVVGTNDALLNGSVSMPPTPSPAAPPTAPPAAADPPPTPDESGEADGPAATDSGPPPIEAHTVAASVAAPATLTAPVTAPVRSPAPEPARAIRALPVPARHLAPVARRAVPPGGVRRVRQRVTVVRPVVLHAHVSPQPAATDVRAALPPPAATIPAVLRLAVPHARGAIEQIEMQRERREALPPPLPQVPDPGGDAPGGAAGHAGGTGGGMLVAFLAAFFFVAPGLTHWLWDGTEHRPRLLRAGRLERPG